MKSKRPILRIFIHLAGWVLLYLLPPLVLQTEIKLPSSFGDYMYWFIVIVFFYINYLWLIPRYLSKRRFIPYFMGIFLMLATTYFANEAYHRHVRRIEEAKHMEDSRRNDEPPRRKSPRFRGYFSSLFCFALLALGTSIRVTESWYENEKQKKEMENQKLGAELSLLKSQINPHFFFNSLNTIRYMIREDPQKARDLLIDLSEIFQRTLRSGEFVPLRDELGYVAAYLSLEKARLGDRLRIVWGGVLQARKPLETESPLLDVPVPTLALQPIVENAVLHGIGKKKEGGTVSVSVERQNNDLMIRIEDDGTGMEADQKANLLQPGGRNKTGIGVKNVDARLRMLYGPEYGMLIDSEVEKGTRVTIRVPEGKGEKK